MMGVNKIVVLLFINSFLRIHASHHWIVTENGRIQSQVENSGFPLTRPDDLMALLEQEEKLLAITRLYEQLISLRKSIDIQWSEIEREGDLEKRLYSSDSDCLLGEIPLSQHNLNTEFLDSGQSSRPKIKETYHQTEPDCTIYSELDFSMRTFPHLETLNKRENLNLMINSVPSKVSFDFNIDALLKQNNSDWTAYNVAALYWRTVGNGTNAVECARRALYFAPRNKRYIALLNLGTLLQELHSLGEAAIILHSAVDHDPVQYISHLALGNVYAALGDYKRSLACYENVLNLDPENMRAMKLKHALLCHKKLESGLLDIHLSLKKILKDIQKRNAMHEEWLHLQNQINWKRNGRSREFLTLKQPIHLNLQMLLHNVEQQAKTMNEEVSRKVSQKEFETKSSSECIENHKFCFKEQNEENDRRKAEGSTLLNFEEGEEDVEESELELLDNSEYSLKNKLNSLITFIKSNYEQETNVLDIKEKVNHQLNVLKEINGEAYIASDRPFLFHGIDSSIKDSNDVKKLN